MEIEIYSGFNRFNYTKSDDKIVESDSTPKEANGSSTSKIEVVTTMEDLQTSLEIDASLKVGYSVYSAEAKSRYVHSLKLTTNTVTVLIYGKNAKKYVSNGNLIIPEEKLINLEKGNEANNFIAKYGDSYVSSVTKGGEFFVTFTFYAQSQEEKEEVEASLDASGVAGGVEIDGSFSMKISNALKNSNVQYSINSSINGFGSDLTLPKFINPEQFSKEIVDFALSFSSREPTIPTTLDFELKSYHDSGLLTQFKQQFENVKNNTSKFLKSYPNPGWAEKLKELQEVLNTTLDFKRTFDNYNYSDKDLDRKHKQLRADISSLKDFINEVASNPNLKYEELILESYDYGIPEMQYILRKVPGNFMSGAAGGTIFQDVNRSDIPRNMRLIAFQIRKGNIVNCITTFYRKKVPK
ncbi:hypothetical protein V8V91_01535 [Algoriphagus halophilus]|uniref:hypothetical protein n=1 Tax=Algoriphagus halophilus TaxID=226505 RepID=UPI00358EBE4B